MRAMVGLFLLMLAGCVPPPGQLGAGQGVAFPGGYGGPSSYEYEPAPPRSPAPVRAAAVRPKPRPAPAAAAPTQPVYAPKLPEAQAPAAEP